MRWEEEEEEEKEEEEEEEEERKRRTIKTRTKIVTFCVSTNNSIEN